MKGIINFMKKLLSLLCLLCICFSVLSFTSCGFIDQESGKIISKIEKTAEFEDGSSEITIFYTDPYYKPEKFIVPAGKQGDAGVSVLDVTSKDGVGEDEGYTIVTVTLSSKNKDGSYVTNSFKIPDGKTIVDVYADKNSLTGEDEIVFAFSGGGGTISMPMPKFNGVKEMQLVEKEGGGYELQVKYTLGEDEWKTIGEIKAPVGIDKVDGEEINGQYVLTVYYTDGSISPPIPFDKPADPNSWSTAETKPADSVGRVGDFCFAEDTKTIWSKVKEGTDDNVREYWKPVISFIDKTVAHTVSFYLNDGQVSANVHAWKSYDVQHGCYFDSTGASIPIPTREGYDFVGWYRKSEITEQEMKIMTSFNDLTPVHGDLKLYAIWTPLAQ